MELTKEMKEKIDNAKSEEEAKAILKKVMDEAADAGIILNDEDLDKASGGSYPFVKHGFGVIY